MNEQKQDEAAAAAQRLTRPKNITKDKRSWWLSHEAFLSLQALAEQEGLGIPQFLESLSRQLARERLPAKERERIKTEARRIATERQQAGAETAE